MMGAIRERALWLVDQLNAVPGMTATADVSAALGNLPCVLVPPPRRDLTVKAVEWRLVVLGAGPANAYGWETIDDLLDVLVGELPITSAEPGIYQLPGGDPAGVACYIATFTESL